MNIVRKIVDALFAAAVTLARALLVVMVLLIFTNVVLRYLFNSGIRWSEEVVLVIVIWFTFIAMALGVKEDLHININILPKRTPARIQLGLYALKQILQLALAVVMCYYGTKLAINASRSILPATNLPNSINYIVVPISGAFIGIFSLRNLLNLGGRAEAVLRGEKLHA